MAGVSDKALKTNYAENKFRYNGKELQHQEFIDGTGLEEYDFDARMYDPQIGRWGIIDPLAQRTIDVSPYCYGVNNPISNIDVEGKFSINNHYLMTLSAFENLGYSSNISDLIAHYASTYSDNPQYKGSFEAWAITTAEGQPYRKGIDYSATANSQNTKSILYSTWHSMKADGENISDEAAMRRGQEFGWDNIFSASQEAKKVGGIGKLQKNSKGIQELGQGLHALEDAVAHHGEDYAHHNTWDDMYPSQETISKANDVIHGAILVAEFMSDDFSHLSNNISVNVDGMSEKQFGQFVQSLLKGMDEKKVKKLDINNNP